jgi:AcrR family transcriptional regulator
VTSRREVILDAAIGLLGGEGVHRVTHRAVDAAAGLPAGSTSNYFRTRDALLNAVVERFAARERANWDEAAATVAPASPAALAEALGRFIRDAVGPHRTLTLARYAILVESAHHPALRAQLTATGGRVRAYHVTWMRLVGSTNPERDTAIVQNYATGLMLHELAYPKPDFDPVPPLTALIATLAGSPHEP